MINADFKICIENKICVYLLNLRHLRAKNQFPPTPDNGQNAPHQKVSKQILIFREAAR